MRVSTRYRGRFAPSPTGPLHLGSLVIAVGSWLIARRNNGDWLLRIEDIDPPREIPGVAAQQIETLAAFGMRSDEPVLWQSARDDAYADALERLLLRGLAFPCHCRRSDLVATDGIHRHCATNDCAGERAGRQPAIRLRVDDGLIGFKDAIHGHCEQLAGRDIGDVVLRRADGLWAYQLAVVVDDAAQGITEVVRGADLLDSTPRQIVLQRALDFPTPTYAHLPLVVDTNGHKLGKSTNASPVDPTAALPALRAALLVLGQDPRCIASSGNAEAALRSAVEHFDMAAIPTHKHVSTTTTATSAA